MKTKVLISFAVIAKLICAFVFAYAKSWFSHKEAHIETRVIFLSRQQTTMVLIIGFRSNPLFYICIFLLYVHIYYEFKINTFKPMVLISPHRWADDLCFFFVFFFANANEVGPIKLV